MPSKFDDRPGVLFYSGGQLGWRTNAKALERLTPTKASFDSFHHELQERLPHNAGWLVDETILLIDIGRRRRSKLIKAVLNKYTDRIQHVHFLTQLAVGDIAAITQRGLTFSVSIDSTWSQVALDPGVRRRQIGTRAWHRRNTDFERAVFEQAQFVCCTSHWARDSVISSYNVDPTRVLVTPFPIVEYPADNPRPIRHADASHLTFVGNDFARKGGPRVIEWHQAHFADVAELHIASRDRPPSNIDSLRNVVWHGSLSNDDVIRKLLPQSRVFLLPTWADLSPLVLTEAAAAGVPAIASDIAGIPEIVVDGVTGRILPAADDIGFVQAIRELLSDDDLNNRMSSAARHHFANTLSADQSTLTLIEELERVLSKTR